MVLNRNALMLTFTGVLNMRGLRIRPTCISPSDQYCIAHVLNVKDIFQVCCITLYMLYIYIYMYVYECVYIPMSLSVCMRLCVHVHNCNAWLWHVCAEACVLCCVFVAHLFCQLVSSPQAHICNSLPVHV